MTQTGSAPAPEEELTTHLPALRAFAISLTRNISAADDLVQETIVKAWSNLSRFEAGTNMRAWLFTILRNTHFSNRRKRKREVPDSDGMYARRLSVRPEHDGRLAFSEFLVAFDKLSDEHREVLVLVGASGFSYEEAAGMIGVAVGTVKSRANRARARLQELLGVSQGEDLVGTPTDHALMAAATAGGEGTG
jgi:RNA polymerase sigma-70 factor (ECF subfamily)